MAADMNIAALALEEDKNLRGYFERPGWRYHTRTYTVPVGVEVELPQPGDYFPGATSGPTVTRNGGSGVRPARKDSDAVAITIIACEPIMDTEASKETYTYGT